MRPYPKNTRLDHAVYADLESRVHVVINAHPRFARWPAGVDERLWDLALEQRDRGDIVLYAACLMPDHLHMLVAPAGRDVIAFVDSWKSIATRVAWGLGVRGQLFQPGWWDRVVLGQAGFDSAVEYIIRNPFEAGLITDGERWPHAWAWHS